MTIRRRVLSPALLLAALLLPTAPAAVDIPNEVFLRFVTLEQLREFKRNHVGIFSVTVYAQKP